MGREELRGIRDEIRAYMGIQRKRPIKEIFELLFSSSQENVLPNYGDDAAAISWGNGYLLFSADGIMKGLLKSEPYAAGKASVMVTVNDIYSMGGRPIALVNVLASGDGHQRREILRGIRKGCEKLKVPMVGGHLHPDVPPDLPELSVAILGYGTRLLQGWKARPGDEIIVAVDLDGQAGCKSVMSWDSNSHKDSEEILSRLEALVIISEMGLAHASKDISNAGLLGTISIMAENSGTGALIDVQKIPCPGAVGLRDWVRCFQSYGFVLSVDPKHTHEVIRIFGERRISAERVGYITDKESVWLSSGGQKELLFDFSKDYITGIRAPRERSEA